MQNTNNEKAEHKSTVVEFYNRCCKSSGTSVPWDSLHPSVQHNFTNCVNYIHQVIYQGG